MKNEKLKEKIEELKLFLHNLCKLDKNLLERYKIFFNKNIYKRIIDDDYEKFLDGSHKDIEIISELKAFKILIEEKEFIENYGGWKENVIGLKWLDDPLLLRGIQVLLNSNLCEENKIINIDINKEGIKYNEKYSEEEITKDLIPKLKSYLDELVKENDVEFNKKIEGLKKEVAIISKKYQYDQLGELLSKIFMLDWKGVLQYIIKNGVKRISNKSKK